MESNWSELETTTHQHHVIAHVIGATILGYIVLEDAIHFLLDIGFIWKVYVDSEMGLLPHPVAASELDVDSRRLTSIKAEIDLLLNGAEPLESLSQFVRITNANAISAVQLLSRDDHVKILIEQETGFVEVDLSTTDSKIELRER